MILTSLKWQLIGGAAGVALLTVSGLWVYATIDNRHLTKVNRDLTAEIEAPVTGFRARLATETVNRANLEASLERQNAEWQRQSAAGAATLADTTRRLAIAQKATRRAEGKVAVLLASPPKGNTLAERLADVDARVLESLE